MRLVLEALIRAYVRVRVEGFENVPDEPYILCINHPSWLDPVVLGGTWPDRRRLSVFGPREQDMSVGARNHLITWSRRGVPFKPGGADALDAARRAAAVLQRGDLLVVAGEGRLSDEENVLRPLEPGVAHFALMAGVPIVPCAVIGTRWVHFGSTIRYRVAPPIRLESVERRRGTRVAVAEITARAQTAIQSMLDNVVPSPRPGRFGAWLSELFNDRPWLDAPEEDAAPF